MSSDGWIKIHRKLQEHPLWNGEKFSRGQAWVDLILLANHKDSFFYKRGVKIDVKRGQCARSAVELSSRWGWSRTKVMKFLKDLEKEQQIEQQKTNVTQLVTITNYDDYQKKEQQKSSRKAAERHIQECKECKEENKNTLSSKKLNGVPYSAIVDFLNEQAGTNFRATTAATKGHIRARWNEGFTLEDFKKVIIAKVDEWSTDAAMVKYIRPQTLFGTKFESYLQTASADASGNRKSRWIPK